MDRSRRYGWRVGQPRSKTGLPGPVAMRRGARRQRLARTASRVTRTGRIVVLCLALSVAGTVSAGRGDDVARSVFGSAGRIDVIVGRPAELTPEFPDRDCEPEDTPWLEQLIAGPEESECERREREMDRLWRKILRRYPGDPTREIAERVVATLRDEGAMTNLYLAAAPASVVTTDVAPAASSRAPRLELVTERLVLAYYPLAHHRYRMVLRAGVRLVPPGARRPSWKDHCLVDLKAPRGERATLDDFASRKGRLLLRSLERAIVVCTDQLVDRLGALSEGRAER